MNIPRCSCFLVDIDGTLTKYRQDAMLNLLHGNFLFPIIRDLMVESGWKKEKAEEAVGEYSNTNIFWDYPDFIAEFKLSSEEAFRRFRQWHAENIQPCEDGITLVKKLYADGKKLFIMSNNPYSGCIFKLQTAGLADDDFQSPYFERIFGTNILRGCKFVPGVWERACACIPAAKTEICVVGDNPTEDQEIPASCGITHSILLKRNEIIRGIDQNKIRTEYGMV